MVMHSNPNSIKLKVTTTLYLTTNISTHTLHNLAFDDYGKINVCKLFRFFVLIWGLKTFHDYVHVDMQLLLVGDSTKVRYKGIRDL